MADAAGDQAERDRRVAVHRDLRAPGGLGRLIDGLETEEQIAQIILRPGVAGIEGQHGVAHDVLVLPAETFLDQRGDLLDIEIENPGDDAEHVDVLALVFRGAADRLDRARRDRHADLREAMIVGVGLDVIRVVEEHAAGPQRADVGVVAVLVKRDEHVGAIAGGEDVARAHAHLEDRRPAGDGGRDRHVRHHVLVAAPGEPGEKATDGLDAVLRVAGQPDDNVLN